jgi:PAS domain S-box-containing protein
MEELKATQEQAARQAEKFISFTNSVNHTMIRAEYDKEGTLIYANTKFLKKLGYAGNREVEGKPISMFIHSKDLEWFQRMWEDLSKGGAHFEGYMKHVTRQGQDLWTMATYTCIRKEDGSVDRILFLAIDTTEQKKQSLDYEGQLSALNRLNLKVEFAPDGKLLNSNELFVNTLKYSVKELGNMSVFDFVDRKDLENFNDLWEQVIAGAPYQGQIRMFTKFRDEKWFRATFTAVNDRYGEVAKVIYIANEITNEKLMEAEARKQSEQMKSQEEKLKLAGLELKKKLDDTNERWTAKVAEKDFVIELLGSHHEDSESLLISFDEAGLIIYINPGAEKLLQSGKEKLNGMPSKALLESPVVQSDDFLSKFFTKPVPGEDVPERISLRTGNDKTIYYRVKIHQRRISGKGIVNLALSPEKM